MLKQATDFKQVLRLLAEHQVDCIVVGGVAATLLGAPLNTFDLDFVHRQDQPNIERLLRALAEMDAVYRIQPERRSRPNESHLVSPGHQLLITKYGAVDFLGTIGNGRKYADLRPHTVEVRVGEFSVRVLDLPTQIEVKEEVGREKDKYAVQVLRAVLAEQKAGGGTES